MTTLKLEPYMAWWAHGTGKWPQKSLTQWLFKEHIHQFPTVTWPIHGIKAPYCTDQVFYLLNARFFGFWRSLVKSLSDWLLLFLFSFVCSWGLQSTMMLLDIINKVSHEVSLCFGFSLLGSSFNKITSFICNAESSFLITVIHILLFKLCVTREGGRVSGSKLMSTMAHNGAGFDDGTNSFASMQLKLNSCGWWCGVWQNKNKL